ncbi:type IV pilus assembly protein PilM [Legionella sp. CNM-1927-20]|uniref:type IV pilus assembly protein PilM n=1 Tax=Legionella sp. CNM-1927-20 TaxID=3422221 RepID=UPI00403B0C53
MFNFSSKCPPILGIDISSTSIKIVEMSGKEGHRIVEGYGYQPLPPNTMEGHTIKDIDAVGRTIQDVINRSRLKAKLAILSLPDSSVISKVIQVNEGLNNSEIEELVIMEADKFIPFPIEEVNIDFEIIGHSAKNTALLDVLVVASRSENVATRVEAATKAGLQVKIMDVESFAVERACNLAIDIGSPIDNKITAVIDIGALFANLFVLKNKEIIFTREEEFGGNQLIGAIEQHYHISHEEALQLVTQSQLPADYQKEIINPFLETLILHVKRALQFFYSTSNYSNIDQILLTGGVAKIPHIEQKVEEEIKITTLKANPFSYLALGRKLNPEYVANDASLLMIACGLALRNIGKAL